MNPLAQAFYDIAIEEGNTASLEVIRNAAFAKMASGETKSIISTSLNGKTFSFNISKPADALFADISTAIRQYNRVRITAIEWDFSALR